MQELVLQLQKFIRLVHVAKNTLQPSKYIIGIMTRFNSTNDKITKTRV